MAPNSFVEKMPQARPTHSVFVDDYIAQLDVSPDGKWVFLGLSGGDLVGVSVDTGRTYFRTQAHQGGLLGLSVSQCSPHVATCGHDGRVLVFHFDGSRLLEIPATAKSWVQHVRFSPTEPLLAFAVGRQVFVKTLAGESRMETEPLPSTVSDVCFRPDGTGLAASAYGGVWLWPLVQARTRFLPWKGSILSCVISPDSKIIASACQDNTVHFWRLSSGKDSQMRGYATKPRALAWSSNSRLLATSDSSDITLWKFYGGGPEGTRPVRLSAHNLLCTQLSFQPGTDLLASGGQDGRIFIWRPEQITLPVWRAESSEEITAVRFSPTQGILFVADAAGVLQMYPSP